VTTRLKESTTSTNFARWLSLALGQQQFESGNQRWFESLPLKTTEAQPTIESLGPKFHPPLLGTPRAHTPSSAKLDLIGSKEKVSIGDKTDAAELGIEIHAALAGLEWIDHEPPTFANRSREARTLLEAFFHRTEAKEVFAKPADSYLLWRERAFDVMLDGEWFSGVFDRVVLDLNAEAYPISATIYDFKTDHATKSEIETRYSPQMDSYRRALCAITKLPLEAVKTRLVAIR
jgi:hypothetical protein